VNGMVAGALLRRSPAANTHTGPGVAYRTHAARGRSTAHKLFPLKETPIRAKDRGAPRGVNSVFGGALLRRSPAAHNHSMCYENML
jgi:hypothetical protein